MLNFLSGINGVGKNKVATNLNIWYHHMPVSWTSIALWLLGEIDHFSALQPVPPSLRKTLTYSKNQRIVDAKIGRVYADMAISNRSYIFLGHLVLPRTENEKIFYRQNRDLENLLPFCNYLFDLRAAPEEIFCRRQADVERKDRILSLAQIQEQQDAAEKIFTEIGLSLPAPKYSKQIILNHDSELATEQIQFALR